MYVHVPYICIHNAILIIGHPLNDVVFLQYLHVYIYLLLQLPKDEYVPVLCPVHSEYNTSGMKVVYQ